MNRQTLAYRTAMTTLIELEMDYAQPDQLPSPPDVVYVDPALYRDVPRSQKAAARDADMFWEETLEEIQAKGEAEFMSEIAIGRSARYGRIALSDFER